MSMVVAKIDWRQPYTFASRQALLGFCFDGIERLTKEFSEELKQNPMGRDLLMTWMGAAQQIRRQNVKVNAVASKLFSMLREDGMLHSERAGECLDVSESLFTYSGRY